MPFEQYQRRRRELGIDHEPTEPKSTAPHNNFTPELSSLRNHKILDSAVSGTVAGGLLRALKCKVLSKFIVQLNG